MRLPKLDIVTGEVVNVQLTTETHVRGAQAGGGRKGGGGGLQLSSRVLNRMRVFLMTSEGKERDFSFTNSTVGVREGHRVSIVRASAPKAREPVLVMLHNHSTGQREEITRALTLAVGQKVLAARWRALGASIVLFIILTAFGAMAPPPAKISVFFALLIAGLLFPVIWVIVGALDQVLLPRQERELSDRLRAEIEGRLSLQDQIEPQPPAKGH